MVADGFPAELFHLGGSPEEIRGSARRWEQFGQTASETGGRIASIDTSAFVGSEGDTFREKVNSGLPPHLRTTGEAFSQVGMALRTFASTLEDLQGQMRPLASQAPHLWEQMQAAQGRVTQAKAADARHEHAVQQAAQRRAPDQPPAPPDTYHSDAGAAAGALSAAHQAWQQCVDRANQVRSAMSRAAQTCAQQIDEAKGKRFKQPPSGWNVLGQAQDFIREHKDALRELSSMLQAVSFVAGVLSLVPGLGEIMAPIALVAGALAAVIDLAVYSATGEGNLTDIAIDVGLTLLPGVGKLGKVLKPGLVAEGLSEGKAGMSAAERAIGEGEAAVGDGAKAGRAEARPEEPREPARGDAAKKECGDPVDVATGAVVLRQTDVELPGVLPLVLRRVHLSSYRLGRWFGRRWASTLDERVEVDAEGVVLVRGDGVVLTYPHPPAGVPVLPVEGQRWPLERTEAGGYLVTDPETGQARHFAAGSGGVWPLSAVTDRAGHRIDVVRDASGAPEEVRHSGGYRVRVQVAEGRVVALRLAGEPDVELVRFDYADGQLAGVVNSSGRALRFGYDHAGRLTEWVDRNGTWYSYGYDAEGRCVRQAGSDGFMAYTFDYGEGVTVATNSLGQATTYHINEAKQIVREVDPLGGETRSEWDRYDRLLARTDPLGRTTRFDYDQAGNLVEVIRPDGGRSVAEYNDLRLPTVLTEPDGSVWRQDYDAVGNRTAVVDPAGATTRFGYAEHGHLTSVTDAAGVTRTVETDGAGLPVAVMEPDGTSTRYRRDAFGRVVEIVDPVGGVTHLAWTPERRLTSRTLPDGAVETWSYDGEGNLVEHVDAAGNVTRTAYTHFDLPAAQIGPDGARLEFSYDTDLRLVRVTNPQGLSWDYHYDPAGRLVSESDFNGRVLRYQHDAAGQLVGRINGAGQAVEYVRDALGRVVEQHTDDGQVTRFSYDPAGRLVRASSPDAELTLERDALGRVLAETVNGRTVTSAYDPLGRRTRRATPSGTDSAWSYDVAGNLVELLTAGRSIRFDRDRVGREVRRHLGTAALLEQTWDANHRLTGQAVSSTGIGPAPGESTDRAGTAQDAPRLVLRRHYTYRADGYLLGVDDLLDGSRRFDLDPAGRVTAVHGAGWAERYAYDTAGNMTDASWPAAPAAHAALGAREYRGTLITRAGNVRYRHDAQGRIVTRRKTRLSRKSEIWHYTWDAEDRLTGVTTPDGQRWRYRYDPLGRRIAKQRLAGDGTTVLEQVDFVWDGTTLAEQTAWHGEGAAPRTTTWEHDGLRPVSQTERSQWRDAPQSSVDERFYSIITDLVGTPSELIDEAGTVAWHTRTTLWGNTTWDDTGPSTPLRFPGQYFDQETGLNYNYFRYYDPETARYTAPDPLGLAPSPNPDTYVHNPHTWADPFGLAPEDCSGAGERKPWQVTPEGTAETARHPRFGNFYKSKSDGLWWSRDTAGHGGSAWKVFDESDKGLHWTADADEYGDFIVGKHKGPTGQFIPWKELKRR